MLHIDIEIVQMTRILVGVASSDSVLNELVEIGVQGTITLHGTYDDQCETGSEP
jgi:hypothetical protein